MKEFSTNLKYGKRIRGVLVSENNYSLLTDVLPILTIEEFRRLTPDQVAQRATELEGNVPVCTDYIRKNEPVNEKLLYDIMMFDDNKGSQRPIYYGRTGELPVKGISIGTSIRSLVSAELNGNIYVGSWDSTTLNKFYINLGFAKQSINFGAVVCDMVEHNGSIYIATTPLGVNGTIIIKRLDGDGTITDIATTASLDLRTADRSFIKILADSTTNKLLISSYFANTSGQPPNTQRVLVVDLADTNQSTNISTAITDSLSSLSPYGMAVNNGFLYVPRFNGIAKIDLSTLIDTNIPTPSGGNWTKHETMQLYASNSHLYCLAEQRTLNEFYLASFNLSTFVWTEETINERLQWGKSEQTAILIDNSLFFATDKKIWKYSVLYSSTTKTVLHNVNVTTYTYFKSIHADRNGIIHISGGDGQEVPAAPFNSTLISFDTDLNILYNDRIANVGWTAQCFLTTNYPI